MLYTRCGSEDGFVARRFLEGKRYDMADGLARYFIRMHWGVECMSTMPVDTLPPVQAVASPFSFTFI